MPMTHYMFKVPKGSMEAQVPFEDFCPHISWCGFTTFTPLLWGVPHAVVAAWPGRTEQPVCGRADQIPQQGEILLLERRRSQQKASRDCCKFLDW